MEKAKTFFKKNGLLLNWKEFEKLDHTKNKYSSYDCAYY